MARFQTHQDVRFHKKRGRHRGPRGPRCDQICVVNLRVILSFWDYFLLGGGDDFVAGNPLDVVSIQDVAHCMNVVWFFKIANLGVGIFSVWSMDESPSIDLQCRRVLFGVWMNLPWKTTSFGVWPSLLWWTVLPRGRLKSSLVTRSL